jgi:hypothetical protein
MPGRVAGTTVVMMRGALVVLFLLALPAAAGADAWQDPVRLGATEISSPHVAVRANGEAVALWTREQTRLVAAFRRPSGAWSKARRLARGRDITGEQVAIDRGGRAIAVWLERPGRVMASARAPGGRFGKPVRLGRGARGSLHLALRSGRAAVTWATSRGVRLAWGRHGVFQRPRRMRSWGSDAAVALGRAGRLHVLFARRKGIFTVSGRPGGGFRAPRRLATGTSPMIAVAGRGDVVAAWADWAREEAIEPPSPRPIRAAIAAPGHRFGALQRVTPDVPRALAPRLAVGPRGDALITWSYAGFDYPVPGIRAWVAARPAGGAFGPAQPLSAPGEEATTPAVAVDRHGTATVAFAARSAATELRVTRGPVGGPLPVPTVLATSPVPPAGATAWCGADAAAAAGLTVLLWSRGPSNQMAAFSAGG